MTEVRDIEVAATPPANEDWVLVERAGSKFAANGAVTAIDGMGVFKPEPFDTLDEAVTASLVWAEKNDVPYVYVRLGD